MYVKKCQFQYVICLSAQNSIILSCTTEWGSKSFLKGLESQKNTFDPLCLNLALYLSHCLGFWEHAPEKAAAFLCNHEWNNSANIYNLPLHFMRYKLMGLKIYITLISDIRFIRDVVVSSWSFSWKYIYPLKKKQHYFWNGGNDDLNMFSDNGTTLLMNSNFLTTSGGIKLMDYIIHLWKLIWWPSNCDLIVSCAIKH